MQGLRGLLLAAALPTAVGLALLVATVAGLEVLLRTGLFLTYPWPQLSLLRSAAALVLLSGCWLTVSAPFEGRVLLTVAAGRGLTLGDLLVVPPLLLATVLVVKHVA